MDSLSELYEEKRRLEEDLADYRWQNQNRESRQSFNPDAPYYHACRDSLKCIQQDIDELEARDAT